MRNTLFRQSSVTIIPPRPPRPSTPPRTIKKKKIIKTVTLDGGGTIVYVIWNNVGSMDVKPGARETITEVEEVTHIPGDPGDPGAPGAVVFEPPASWTAFGNSIGRFSPTGYVEFSVPLGIAGVVIGLSHMLRPPELGYGHIVHGLRLTGGRARLLWGDDDLSAYTASDVFRIEVTMADGVTYYKNGVSIRNEPSRLQLGLRVYLAAAMYNRGDYVFDPVIKEVASASATAALPPLRVLAGDDVPAFVVGKLPGLKCAARTMIGVRAKLPPMAGFASTKAVASVIRKLPALKARAMAAPRVELTTTVISYFAPLAVTAVGVTPPTSRVNASLGAMRGFAADHALASSSTKLAPLYGFARLREHTQADMRHYVVWGVGADPIMTSVAVMISNVSIGITQVPSRLIDEVIEAGMKLQGTMAALALRDALVQVLLGIDQLEPAAPMTETWVANMRHFGTSQYTNYGFNSFAKIDGRYYGASDEGIVELEGDTDVGSASVNARIGFGNAGFGSTLLKAMRACYVGMSASGNLFLKIKNTDGEFIYRTRTFSDEMRRQRIDTGRGLRSNYFEIELFSTDGTDFELDTVEFNVVDLTRRIR